MYDEDELMRQRGELEMKPVEFVAPEITAIIKAKPVIKCSECKYWFSAHGHHGVCEYFRQKESMPIGMDADDFCSRAEIGNKTT